MDELQPHHKKGMQFWEIFYSVVAPATNNARLLLGALGSQNRLYEGITIKNELEQQLDLDPFEAFLLEGNSTPGETKTEYFRKELKACIKDPKYIEEIFGDITLPNLTDAIVLAYQGGLERGVDPVTKHFGLGLIADLEDAVLDDPHKGLPFTELTTLLQAAVYRKLNPHMQDIPDENILFERMLIDYVEKTPFFAALDQITDIGKDALAGEPTYLEKSLEKGVPLSHSALTRHYFPIQDYEVQSQRIIVEIGSMEIDNLDLRRKIYQETGIDILSNPLLILPPYLKNAPNREVEGIEIGSYKPGDIITTNEIHNGMLLLDALVHATYRIPKGEELIPGKAFTSEHQAYVEVLKRANKML